MILSFVFLGFDVGGVFIVEGRYIFGNWVYFWIVVNYINRFYLI